MEKRKVKLTVGNLKFDAAHNLYGYEGKCKNLHGHTYKMEVTVEGEPSKVTGMVVDFGDVKRIINTNIVDVYDHQYLNDLFDVNPTAENMVVIFFDVLSKKFSEELGGIQLLSVKLWETENCCAEVSV